LAERAGCVELRFRLVVEQARLHYVLAGCALRLGPAAVPLPRWLAPRVEAHESVADGDGAHVRVAVSFTLSGPFLTYEGIMTPEART
jgi:hypothetical protein